MALYKLDLQTFLNYDKNAEGGDQRDAFLTPFQIRALLIRPTNRSGYKIYYYLGNTTHIYGDWAVECSSRPIDVPQLGLVWKEVICD